MPDMAPDVQQPRRITLRQHDTVVQKLLGDYQTAYATCVEQMATIVELRARIDAANMTISALRKELAAKEQPMPVAQGE